MNHRRCRPLALEELEPRDVPTQVLVLDFDGAVVPDRAGDFALPTDPVVIPPFNLALLGFGGQETRASELIVGFVRADYQPFDVEVRTSPPPTGAFTEVFIGGSDFFNEDNLGIATLESTANRDPSNYAFIFPQEFDSYASSAAGDIEVFSEYIGNTVSHEAAHTLGLLHYDGARSDLMGSFLPHHPVQQSFGTSVPGLTRSFRKDDYQVLGSTVGFSSPGGDDRVNTVVGAESLQPGAPATGIIESWHDVDVFRVNSLVTSQVNVVVQTDLFSDLDGVLTVRDATGTEVATGDDNGDDHDPSVTWVAVAGAEYSVELSPFGQRSAGPYTIELSRLDGPHLALTDAAGVPLDNPLELGQVMADGPGGDRARVTMTLTSVGTEAVTIADFQFGGDAGFTLAGELAALPGLTLAVGESFMAEITFDPDDLGPVGDTWTIQSNADLPPLELAGEGTEVVPIVHRLDAGNPVLEFEDAAGESVTVRVTGRAVVEVTLTEARINGEDIATLDIIRGSGRSRVTVDTDSLTNIGQVRLLSRRFGDLSFMADVNRIESRGRFRDLHVTGQLVDLDTSRPFRDLIVGTVVGSINLGRLNDIEAATLAGDVRAGRLDDVRIGDFRGTLVAQRVDDMFADQFSGLLQVTQRLDELHTTGPLTGTIIVHGDVRRIVADDDINADIEIGDDVQTIFAAGDLDGTIDVADRARAIIAGQHLQAAVTVGDDLFKLMAGHDIRGRALPGTFHISGDINVADRLRRLIATGQVTSAVVNVGRLG